MSLLGVGSCERRLVRLAVNARPFRDAQDKLGPRVSTFH